MKLILLRANCHNGLCKQLFKTLLKRPFCFFYVLAIVICFSATQAVAQGSWTAIKTLAPDASAGVMLLLTDGTVICKSSGGGTDGIGNTWDRLSPDSLGSYVNGKWSRIKPMINTRLYFSSQVLKDGRVYVSGGEYGTGGSSSEVYDPTTNIWTAAPAPGGFISDANSEILEDGRILQALVNGTLKGNKIYNPQTNTYGAGPSCLGIHNESTWLKLPDNSILMVDRGSRNSERFIPSLNKWVADAVVPVDLFDPFGLETGAALLLPDGRAFFIGSLGHTAYYTPTGNNSPGAWAAGPDIPKGLGQTDAPAAMMVNSHILLTAAPKPTAFNVFAQPTSFFDFNYKTNKFTQISTPAGALNSPVPCYVTMMLDLPDGTVLCSYQDSTKYYVFKPTGPVLTAARPVIKKIIKNAGMASYSITGTLFNGISQGANYGDDWQMNTNYPIVRLTDVSNSKVYYAKSYNWNSTGVRRAGLKDTAQFALPAGLPPKTYSLEVVANGIASLPVAFTPVQLSEQPLFAASEAVKQSINEMGIYPNPSSGASNLYFSLNKKMPVLIQLFDINGKEIATLLRENLPAGNQTLLINTGRYASGIYLIKIITQEGATNLKLMIQ